MSEEVQRETSMSLCNSSQDLTKYVENEVLLLLQEDLAVMGKCLQDYGLPNPDNCNRFQKIPHVIQDKMFIVENQRKLSENRCSNLNSDQQNAFCTIMKAVHDETYTHRMFFLNAPGGYGKTFLIEALLCTVRGMGKIALAVASSEIAAKLLEGGRIAHSQFKIPIPVNESSVCSISLQSNDAKLIFGMNQDESC